MVGHALLDALMGDNTCFIGETRHVLLGDKACFIGWKGMPSWVVRHALLRDKAYHIRG